MNITKRIGRDGRIGLGMALLTLMAVLATLQLALWVSRSFPLPVAGVATINYSPMPRGYTDYANLYTVAPRAHFSTVPQGLTDYQPQVVAAPKSILSSLPQGLTDYQALQPRARVNHSAVPNGLTDYQGLQTNVAAQPHFSEVPRGWSDYKGLLTSQAEPKFSPLPRGWTDYLSPAR